ncbi:MAG: hypothetical protein ACR2QJ_14505 [Geminicoccaceae bacterium]
MVQRIINKGTAFWLLASAGLTGVITLQVKDGSWLTPPVTAAIVEPAQIHDGDQTDLADRSPDADWLDSVVERPLFSTSRRPFSPPEDRPEITPEQDAGPLTLSLTGTLLTGEARIALLIHPTKGLLRLRRGQKVEGWQVEEISDVEVRLRRGEEVTLLSLLEGVPNLILQQDADENLPTPAQPRQEGA